MPLGVTEDGSKLGCLSFGCPLTGECALSEVIEFAADVEERLGKASKSWASSAVAAR